jgi:hypothetical protein
VSSEHLADTAPVSEKVDVSGAATTAAEKRDSSPIEHLLVFTPFIIIALLASIILRYSATRLDNQDTWFHLSLGSHFSTDWSLSHPGALTPFATSSWVPTQWSTEVVATWVESRWGLPGVAWLFGAAYFALVLATYVVCRRKSRMLPAAAVTVLVVFASASTLSARPQVVSLVLVAVTVHAWLSTWDDGRLRWWLVPMTWLWATAHGLWSVGVLLGLAASFGLLLDRRLGGFRTPAAFAVPVFSLAVTALTPVGPHLLLSQLAVSARTSLIPEWGPTSFQSVPALVAGLMVGALAAIWARRGRVAWTHLLLLALAGALVLMVTRLVPLGAIVVAPMLAQALDGVLPRQIGSPGRLGERLALSLIAVAYLGTLAFVTPHTAGEPGDVPTALQPRIATLPRGSVLLVEDGIGGWVEWAEPQVYPVIDGMLDAYPVDYIRQFYDFKRVAPGWQGFVNRSGARDAVLLDGSPVSAALQDQLGWTVVQKDREWVYLEAPAA